MVYEPGFLKLREQLQVYAAYSRALVNQWQAEEHRQKGRPPTQALREMRAWARQMEFGYESRKPKAGNRRRP